MRLKIDGQEYEVRVQKRQVTYVDIMQSGKFLARGEAVLNPLDEPVANDVEGITLAATRALKNLAPLNRSLFAPFYRRFIVSNILSKLKAAKIRKFLKVLRPIQQQLRAAVAKIKAQQKANAGYGPNRIFKQDSPLRFGYAPGVPEPMGPRMSNYDPATITAPRPRYSPDFEGTAPGLSAPRSPDYGPGRLAPPDLRPFYSPERTRRILGPIAPTDPALQRLLAGLSRVTPKG